MLTTTAPGDEWPEAVPTALQKLGTLEQLTPLLEFLQACFFGWLRHSIGIELFGYAEANQTEKQQNHWIYVSQMLESSLHVLFAGGITYYGWSTYPSPNVPPAEIRPYERLVSQFVSLNKAWLILLFGGPNKLGCEKTRRQPEMERLLAEEPFSRRLLVDGSLRWKPCRLVMMRREAAGVPYTWRIIPVSKWLVTPITPWL